MLRPISTLFTRLRTWWHTDTGPDPLLTYDRDEWGRPE
jgi:hypothetical protein